MSDAPETVIENSETQVPSLVFPVDLQVGIPAITFSFRDYAYQYAAEAPTITPDITIALPLPAAIQTNYGLVYDNIQMGAIFGTLVENEGIKNKATNIAARAGLNLSAMSGLPTQDVYQQLTGSVINPFNEVLFRAPEFRQFSFDFIMIPRNAKETELIEDVVRNIKKRIYPYFAGSNKGFFNYPSLLSIRIDPPEAERYFFRVDRAVVAGFQVSRNELGSAFFAETKAPIATRISMHVMETEMLIREDKDSFKFRGTEAF